jgi:hypothetical protein
MRYALLGLLVLGLVGNVYAVDDLIDQDGDDGLAAQLQGQAQGQAQGQVGIVDDGAQTVNVPRQHRNTPNVTVQTAPGQSGFGVSFPGGSVTGVETDEVDKAAKFIALCQQEGVECSPAEIQQAKHAAKRSLKTCYLLGPVGKLLSYIPGRGLMGLDFVQDTQGALASLCW